MKKQITKFFGIATLMLGMFFFQSCTDACKDVVCLNNGVCDEGDCICTKGYESADCSVEMRTKFLGSWKFLDACYANVESASTISVSSQAVERVIISNILGTDLGGSAYAEIDGTSIKIPTQTVVDNVGASWTVEGVTTGNFTNNSFTINVKYTFSTTSELCLLTFTKQ